MKMSIDAVSLAGAMVDVYDKRARPGLSPETEQLTNIQRIRFVLSHLKRERSSAINAISQLASMIDDIDRDIALIESMLPES